ncbi:O-antigen ligase family protein [Desulfococcaceae bacterium HSG8]|nr:O-antigen ligase family protein [Desulfococcaceae bacterium HSG8]
MRFVVPPSGGVMPPEGGTANFDPVCFLLEITLPALTNAMNSRLSSLSLAAFLIPAVTILVIGTGFFLRDKAVLVLGIPIGISLVLLSWQAPRVLALVIVSLIPLGNFAGLSETMGKLTLFKLFFLPFSVLIIGFALRRFEPIPFRLLDKWIFSWVAVNIFFIISSADKGEAIGFCRRLASLSLFYFTLTRFFYRTDRFHLLIQTVIVSTFVSVIIGIIAYLSGNDLFFSRENLRFTGASGTGPGVYTASLFLPIWLSVSLAMSAKKFLKKTACYFFAIAMISVIPLTLSRSGALVFIMMIPTAFIVWHKKLRPFHYGVLLAGLLIGTMFIPQSFWDRASKLGQITDVNVSDYSLWRRMNYLEVGWNILKDHPLSGVGAGNFPKFHADGKYQPEISLIGTERLPHNMYMQVMTETGIVGSVFLAGVIISALVTALNGLRRRDEVTDAVARGLFLTLIGILLMGMFSHTLLAKYFWLMLAFIRILAEQSSQPHPL